ncbi:hypothetical protein CR513_01018, partial [Mucuna pruriens]
MLGTEKPKLTRGDRLVYQHTLVDLILNVLASGGGPSSSTVANVVEDGITKSRSCSETKLVRQSNPSRIGLYRGHIGLVSAESNSAIAETSQNSTPQFYIDNSIASSNIFTKPGQMENHDRTLKELATLNVVYQPWRRPSQAPQGISHSLFNDEAVGDTGRLHQNEGHQGLRPLERKYVGSDNTQEKLCMSTGSDSINFAPPVHTIRLANNC